MRITFTFKRKYFQKKSKKMKKSQKFRKKVKKYPKILTIPIQIQFFQKTSDFSENNIFVINLKNSNWRDQKVKK